jgi:hypothetical protein
VASFPQPEYLIPAGTIVFYSGVFSSATNWSRYTAADGKYIIGADVQANITVSNTTVNYSATAGPFSLGAGGDHNVFTGGLNVYAGGSYSAISPSGPVFDSQGPGGSHTHSAGPFGSLPAGVNVDTANVTLIQLSVASNTFPISVIHMSAVSNSPNWTQISAPALSTGSLVRHMRGGSNGFEYTNGNTWPWAGSTAPTIAGHAHPLNTGNKRALGTASPSLNTYIDANPSTPGVNHSHPMAADTGIASLKSKIMKMWTSTNTHLLKNITASSKLIVMYSGNLSDLPDYWKLCDGSNGTIDMRECFVGWSASAGDVHGTDLPATLSYNNLAMGSDPFIHSHATSPVSPIPYAYPGGHTSGGVSHAHPMTPSPTISLLKPPNIYLAFIQFVPYS